VFYTNTGFRYFSQKAAVGTANVNIHDFQKYQKYSIFRSMLFFTNKSMTQFSKGLRQSVHFFIDSGFNTFSETSVHAASLCVYNLMELDI